MFCFQCCICGEDSLLPLGDLPSSVHYGVNSLRLLDAAAGPAAFIGQAPEFTDLWNRVYPLDPLVNIQKAIGNCHL